MQASSHLVISIHVYLIGMQGYKELYCHAEND